MVLRALEELRARLQGEPTAAEHADLAELVAEPDPGRLDRDEVAELLAASGLQSEVTFHASGGEGAFVHYRLIVRELALRTDRATSSSQTIPIGIYEIWSERGGEPTSVPQLFVIVQREVAIDIEEHEPDDH